jgi:hypothetical protein
MESFSPHYEFFYNSVYNFFIEIIFGATSLSWFVWSLRLVAPKIISIKITAEKFPQ